MNCCQDFDQDTCSQILVQWPLSSLIWKCDGISLVSAQHLQIVHICLRSSGEDEIGCRESYIYAQASEAQAVLVLIQKVMFKCGKLYLSVEKVTC